MRSQKNKKLETQINSLKKEKAEITKENLAMKKQIADLIRNKKILANSSQLFGKSEEFDELKSCKICLLHFNMQERHTVKLKCPHILCYSCAQTLTTRNCPFCREKFQPNQVKKVILNPRKYSRKLNCWTVWVVLYGRLAFFLEFLSHMHRECNYIDEESCSNRRFANRNEIETVINFSGRARLRAFYLRNFRAYSRYVAFDCVLTR